MWPLGALGRGFARLRRDLRTDPYLRYVLAVTAVLCLFWLWQRAPNFATWDERERLLDALVAYGIVANDPSVTGVRSGVAWGREPFGATFYLYALACLPAVLVVLATGAGGALTALVAPDTEFGYVAVWQAVPEWFWTASLLLGRLWSVAFGLGAVYLTYRLGTRLRDRATGRLGAALTGLTFALVMLAHEVGEDLPALFFLLLTVLTLLRYLETGRRRTFLAASATGGVAIGFKLTAAPVVALFPIAVVLRARASEPVPRPVVRLLVPGAATGLVAILLSFPTALVGRADRVVFRLLGGPLLRTVEAVGPDAPTWWWYLRGYLHGFGLPLTVVVAVAVPVAAWSLRRRTGLDRARHLLVFVAVLALGVIYLPWHDFRVHHLLPTMPLLVVLAAGVLVGLRERHPAAGRAVVAVLLVTTALYAGAGSARYATLPRDQAATWMTANVDRNATVESYQFGVDHTGIPHGQAVSHPYGDGPAGVVDEPCPEYVMLSRESLLYLRDVPIDRRSGYVDGNVTARAAYLRDMLSGRYNYTPVAEFGSRPPDYTPQRARPGSLVDILALGVFPHSDQYGDEQDLAGEQYILLLERTGGCDPSRAPPW